ncbi:amidohydrolase [Brevibacterium sp. 50QC2O2]|uniref:amidohydrolase n=1 Tax=Brevibacterium TaxID=1696 RepID=UPI00211B8544|nr:MULTISPECIES: amidohydrolase [unclassified Brevibacterium]MCQ9385525.1 amidohydrolase [Brevibacterium sp. 68QC2CO]MCQ9387308.1 amidohydrolase [Brevibacterium sp. 50QC2O2]
MPADTRNTDPKNTPATAARATITGIEPALVTLSHTIHADPEPGSQEFHALAHLAEFARGIPGTQVTTGIGGLETALLATAGTGDFGITICAEYDALPGVGHACGHNIIAAAAAGAFAALAPLADELHATVRLLGTPAEETTGGKIDLLDAGAFAGTSVAMMIHPADHDSTGMRPYACAGYTVRFHGRAAHASMAPQKGVNALDALTVALTAIGLNRQQLAADQQIHYAVHSGGSASNVIPALAEAEFMVRGGTQDSLAAVDKVLQRCLRAGALAAGATVEIEEIGKPYLDIVPDPQLEAIFAAHSAELGRPLPGPSPLAGSTDMGNVSHRFRAIHPMLGLGEGCPPMHSPEFARFAVSEAGDRAVRDGALCMALTGIDAALGATSGV